MHKLEEATQTVIYDKTEEGILEEMIVDDTMINKILEETVAEEVVAKKVLNSMEDMNNGVNGQRNEIEAPTEATNNCKASKLAGEHKGARGKEKRR